MPLNDSGNGGWVMDIGATNHFHANACILKFVSNNHYPRSIYISNGSAIPIVTSGHSTFPIPNIYRTLHLQNVLITPNIIKSLIFVRKFTTNNNCYVDFDTSGFTVLDYKLIVLPSDVIALSLYILSPVPLVMLLSPLYPPFGITTRSSRRSILK